MKPIITKFEDISDDIMIIDVEKIYNDKLPLMNKGPEYYENFIFEVIFGKGRKRWSEICKTQERHSFDTSLNSYNYYLHFLTKEEYELMKKMFENFVNGLTNDNLFDAYLSALMHYNIDLGQDEEPDPCTRLSLQIYSSELSSRLISSGFLTKEILR